jgi:hypothetical protein
MPKVSVDGRGVGIETRLTQLAIQLRVHDVDELLESAQLLPHPALVSQEVDVLSETQPGISCSFPFRLRIVKLTICLIHPQNAQKLAASSPSYTT